MSNFRSDLENEKVLGNYLDSVYSKIFNPKSFQLERTDDREDQHKGIDIIISDKKSTKKYNIDEKAQLDYINIDLPTFAFELSYFHQGTVKLGWLIDEKKTTDYYFLITSIHAQDKNILSGIDKLKIYSINRKKLIKLLQEKGLTIDTLRAYDTDIRDKNTNGRVEIKELDEKTEGYFHFSLNNKSEGPINLVLKLSFLVKSGVGKQILK